MRDEKLHADVARSTFRSQNVQSTPFSDHFWKFRSRKSERRSGAKHISKSKCTKHTSVGPLLEVQISKKCTPLWREAHFQVKMYKTHQHRTTFGSSDLEKVHAIVARSTFRSQNVQSTPFSDHFWKFRSRKSERRSGAKHIFKSKCTKHTSIGPLLEVQISKKCAPLWREAPFWSQHVKSTRGSDHFWWRTRLWILSKVGKTWGFCSMSTKRLQAWDIWRWSAKTHFPWQAQYKRHVHERGWEVRALISWEGLHYTTLQYTKLHYTSLHYITLHYITLHYTTFHYTPLHWITLHYPTLHYTTLHSTTLQYTTLHDTTLHYTGWHCTTDRQVDRFRFR